MVVASVAVSFFLCATQSLAGQKGYDASSQRDVVYVFDTSSGALLKTIQMGFQSRPIGVAVAAGGSRVYVTKFWQSAVAVIDGASDTVIDTIPVGNSPRAVALSPDGALLFTANESDNSVSAYSVPLHSVIATIPVGELPWNVVVSPDASRAYVSNYTGNSVSVIDIHTMSVVATISGLKHPLGTAVSPDGLKLLVANNNLPGSISVVSTATNTIVRDIPAPVGQGTTSVAITPDGLKAYATTGSNQVMVIDMGALAITAMIQVGISPQAIVVSPDGSRVYEASNYDGAVNVISTSTNAMIAKYTGFTDGDTWGVFTDPVLSVSIGPAPVPTLSPWALVGAMGALGAAGWWVSRRRLAV